MSPRAKKPRRKGLLLITRSVEKDEFIYSYKGKRIRSKVEIERINALAIPPAWTNVQIARSPRAKILAKGTDSAGREQAIYHPSFRRRQERKKYLRLVEFAEALPQLRARVDRDLRRRGMPRDRVVACVIRLMDSQYFRVGNPQYAAEHGSYGITTLREDHVHLTDSSVDFDFIGKSGKRHRIKARDRRAARVMKQLLEMKGPEVFRFFDDGGAVRKVNAQHINAYIQRHTGGDFTAKDFRTWGGTLLASTHIFATEESSWETDKTREAAIRDVVKEVAGRLGNTPAVTKSSYIAPQLLSMVEREKDFVALRELRQTLKEREFFTVEEQCVVEVLTLDSA